MSHIANYDSIGLNFTVRFNLSDLSGRDKVNLFEALMSDLGIRDRLTAETQETTETEQIIFEQLKKHW